MSFKRRNVELGVYLALGFELCDLRTGLVPQLVRDSYIHLHTLGHQTLQSGEGLALTLGEPRGVLPLLVDVVLEDAVADPVHGLDQPQLRGHVLGLLLLLGVAVAGLHHVVRPPGLRHPRLELRGQNLAHLAV